VAADAELAPDEAEAVLRSEARELFEVRSAEPSVLRRRHGENWMHMRRAALLRFPRSKQQRQAPTVTAPHRVTSCVMEALPPA
jgi:hypothetical protein